MPTCMHACLLGRIDGQASSAARARRLPQPQDAVQPMGLKQADRRPCVSLAPTPTPHLTRAAAAQAPPSRERVRRMHPDLAVQRQEL